MTGRRVAVKEVNLSKVRSPRRQPLRRLRRRNQLGRLLRNPKLNQLRPRRLRSLQSIVRKGAVSRTGRITRTKAKRTKSYY